MGKTAEKAMYLLGASGYWDFNLMRCLYERIF